MWLRRTWELVPAHVEHLQIGQLAEPRRQRSCAETRLKNCACGMPGQTTRRTIEAHLAQIERCELRKTHDIRCGRRMIRLYINGRRGVQRRPQQHAPVGGDDAGTPA